MRKLLPLLLMLAGVLTLGAVDRIVVCKHSAANASLKTYHLYQKANVSQIDLSTAGEVSVETSGERHTYPLSTIDDIRFSIPEGYEDVGVQPSDGVFVDESMASSLGSLYAVTTRGVAWSYDATYHVAKATGYSSAGTTASESYLMTVEMDMSATTAATLSFRYKMNYTGSTHRVLITDCSTGDPGTTEWTTLIDDGEMENPMSFNTTRSVSRDIPSRYLGESNVTVAFYYSCPASASSTWEISDVTITDKTPSAGGDGGETGGEVDPDNTNRNDVAASRNKEVWRLEFPRLHGGDMYPVVTKRTADYGITYSLEWDCTKKANRWTCYEMYAGNSESNVKRSDDFQEDPDLPSAYRTTLADYRGSGYSRGHLCPSSDRLCSREQNSQTFYLSNMQPQNQEHNGGIWVKLEELIRAWNTDSRRDTLYVVKAATIDSDVADHIQGHTDSGLIVPGYFYMAVLSVKNGAYKAIGIWSPHAGGSTTEYITIDELERRTGIDFFCNLPDAVEQQVEQTLTLSEWPGRP